ncbi:sugar transferase [Ignavigranum ruoffiae]|uniref:sugar transferase n=1 Tax=Ignavigranum ruoffiae TaxID=89093 RepID=UPI0024AD3BCA|nr:sugar transferase [Ignavigranum ruoffiae]
MYKSIKRLLDIVLSLLGLVILSPVFLAIALWIKWDSPGPVFFKQKRVGIYKRFFNIYKFRTMQANTPADIPTHMLGKPESFITRSGQFLRKTSLDELPQLINILRGEMSIIGPRPALWNQDDLVAERDKYAANDVTPGLTGWAQVNGRDELPIPIKAQLDGEYVQKMSLLFDIKCFFYTLLKVFKGEGVVEGGTGSIDRQGKREH